ncbi:uncharacterized protein IL334_005514 [Kwoniella shivajii]|uniref:Ribosome biogenesis protein SLX9 n=1 Tax=Kwoniella shivajii TaxID=564305 RepID=A0ABZ1D4N0_9TREE|nr:hypothetical protein IL334_005514 [Kwoniella shivajii]
MPRTSRTKSRLHTSAVGLPSKLKNDHHEQRDAQEPMIPNSSFDEPSLPTSKAQKKAEFIAAVQSAPHPYIIQSKSHLRREKRRVRSNLSTNLDSLENALESVLPESFQPPTEEEAGEGKAKKDKMKSVSRESKEEEKRKRVEMEREKGKIGEGKGRTLGEKKRRQVIQEASKRIPAVLSHPAYQSNPWAAIREHVGNTVATKLRPVAK